MVRFLEPETSSKQELYDSLTTSINDMIGIYEKRKQGENLAKLLDIPKDKRSEFMSLPPEWQKFYAQNVQREKAEVGKQAKEKEKLLSGASKYVEDEILRRDPSQIGRSNEIRKHYEDLVSQGFPQSKAIAQALQMKEEASEPESGFSLKSLFEPSGERHPSGVPSAAEREKSEYPYGYGSAVKKHPAQAALDLFLTPLGGLEDIGRKLSMMPPGGRSNTPITDWLREKAGISQLSPEAQEELGIGSTALSSLLPLEGVVNELALGTQKMGGVAGKVPRPRPPVRPDLIEGAAYKELPLKGKMPPGEPIPPAPKAPKAPINLDVPLKTRGMPKAAEPPALKGRITEPPATATEMRMERLKPSAKVYPRYQNVLVREQQVKNFPKYADEIHADAVKRAEQAEKRIPKTVKGRESQAIRIHEAEKVYPVAQEGYFKAASRVRALEEQMAKLSESKRAEIEPLYNLAKQELQEAEFYRKQAFENLKGISKRAGIGDMKQAAQKKLTEIAETIAEGEEYQLAKMDYSPDLIKEAKRISKQKPLPHTRGDDFYNQVHETYMNEYRKRLGQIENEMKKLGEQKGLSNVFKRQQLAKEKDIIKKMIESGEAEKKIHYHKFGLRQMAERNKAAQRFAKFQKAEGKPEVGKVAQERMWKNRIQEAKTPEARSQVIDEAVEEIAAKNPSNAEKIKAEGNLLKDELESFFKTKPPKEPPSGAGAKMDMGRGGQKPPSPPKSGKLSTEFPDEPLPKGEEIFKEKTAKESIKEGLRFVRKLQDKFESLLKKVPLIGKHQAGRDFIIGAIGAVADELHKEHDSPITSGDLTVVFGRPGYGGYRILIRNYAKKTTKWAINSWKEHSATEDVKSGKKNLKTLKPSLRKKVIERLKES